MNAGCRSLLIYYLQVSVCVWFASGTQKTDPGLRAQLGLTRPRSALSLQGSTPVVGSSDTIEVFAYSTDHTRLTTQKDSILWSQNQHNTFNYSVLGVHGGSFKQWVSKVKLLMEPLRRLPDDQIILVVDGNDVVFFPCNRSMAESFRLLNASIAFMGVAHQHPDYHLMELFPKVQPVTPHPFPSALSEFLAGANRFINSGVAIGYAGAFRYFFAEYFFRQGQVNQEDWNDQRFWTDLYLGQHLAGSAADTPRLVIDTEGLVVQGFHPTQRYIQNTTDRSVTAYSSSDLGLWGNITRQRLYKHTACLLHAPGGINYKLFLEVMVPHYKQLKTMLFDIHSLDGS